MSVTSRAASGLLVRGLRVMETASRGLFVGFPAQRVRRERLVELVVPLFTQLLSQLVKPVGQLSVQEPSTHISPSVQATPLRHAVSAPQYSLLVSGSTQVPAQSISPAGQPFDEISLHVPETQNHPTAQALPHEPQLSSSVAVSTQLLLHTVIPDGQGAQGLGQLSTTGHGFFPKGFLPKSVLNLAASVPSTSASQSKFPSQ